VGLVPDGRPLKENIRSTTADSNGVIAVVDDTILDSDVCGLGRLC